MSIINLTTSLLYATLTAAIDNSGAGDTLALSAGLYVEDLPIITHSLTIEGVGGLAHLITPNPIPANGRAIISVAGGAGADITLRNLELSGATDELSRSNGAGILFESGNGKLTVSNSWIHNNQDGILSGTTGAIVIDHAEVDHNGVAPTNPRYGFDHNIYVGAANSLTVTNSYIHDALGGHEIKSRAAGTTITDNRIQDGPTATTSYSIDIPDGGAATLTDNTIEKGPLSPNRYAIHFGGEASPSQPGSSLTVQNNLLINDRSAGGTAVYNASIDPAGQAYPATVTGNTIYGFQTVYVSGHGGTAALDANLQAPGPAPALDSSAPWQVPEPPSILLLAAGLLATLLARVLPRRSAPQRPVNTGLRLAMNAARPSR